jgi:ProP effector
MTHASDEIGIQNIIGILAEKFPKCFFVYERRRKPIKIGIFQDLLDELGDSIPESDLSLALRLYTGNRYYLSRASREGAARIDLNGDASGRVSAEEARFSIVKKEWLEQQRKRQAREAKEAKHRDSLASLKAAWRNRTEGGSS